MGGGITGSITFLINGIILNEERQIQLKEQQKKLDEANNKFKFSVREKEGVQKKLKEIEEENRLLRRNLAKIQSVDEIDIEVDLLSQSPQGVEILEKKYAVLLGQLSLQKQLRFELENNHKQIKTLIFNHKKIFTIIIIYFLLFFSNLSEKKLYNYRVINNVFITG